MTSDVRATAMTLAALLEVNPSSALIDPLVAGLKAERDKTGSWRSTQENLWSLVALAEYGRKGTKGDTTLTIVVGGKQVAKKKITGSEIFSTKLPLGASDDVEIKVDKTAHVSAHISEVRVDGGKPISNGFTITRTYATLQGTAATSFKAGDLLTVTLAIKADKDSKWIAVVDPLPAGLEVVNAKLAAGGTNMQQPQQQPDDWASRRQRWMNSIAWDHEEIRDDRVLWFADNLSSGSYEMTYQARATIDGTFTAMPATIEAMYAPDQRARTEKQIVTVTK
jgi:uncharacterized protein YfaS (alpha-2-macroglobulin family)